MFNDYKDLLIAFLVIIALHKFVVPRITENMAPIGHMSNLPVWTPGSKLLDSQTIIDMRNDKFECDEDSQLGCPGYGQNIPLKIVNEYAETNYNPVHLDPTTNQSPYTTHEGDPGQPKPDKFAGVTYW